MAFNNIEIKQPADGLGYVPLSILYVLLKWKFN